MRASTLARFEAPDAEVYGSLVYGNGRQVVVPGYAHGIYVQNDAGQKLIADNVVFGQYGFGIHAYAEGGRLRDLRIAGNVAFANGNVSRNAFGALGIPSLVIMTLNPKPVAASSAPEPTALSIA